MLHSHNRRVYKNEKELCATIHTNMDESHSYAIEQKKPDIKEYICLMIPFIYSVQKGRIVASLLGLETGRDHKRTFYFSFWILVSWICSICE